MHSVDDFPLIVWVIRSILSAGGDKPRPASALLRGPHLFPFDIAVPSIRDLENCDALQITHYGFNHEVLLGVAEAERAQDFLR